MNRLMKIQLVFFLNLFSLPFLGAQISIDFTPIENLCSTDAENCKAAVTYPFSVSVDDPAGITLSHQIKLNGGAQEEDVYGNLSGTYPDYIISGDYPVGEHSLVVTVVAGEDTFEANMPLGIVDCVTPIPICINGLTASIQIHPDSCWLAIDVMDLIAAEVEDCSGGVSCSIHKTGELNSGEDIPDPIQNQVIFGISDELGPNFITIYAWDSAFNPYAVQPDGTVGGPNYDYCETYLILVDSGSGCYGCDEPHDIGGNISKENGDPIKGVQVVMQNSEYSLEITNIEGDYLFENAEHGDISIIPGLDSDTQNGITIVDVVLIWKHILGQQYLNSPYKLIAADINGSGTITVADLIQLRKMVLGIIEEFPNNTSWRFVDAVYLFPNPQNPWAEPFPEVIQINNWHENVYDINFIGIKIGDVNY